MFTALVGTSGPVEPLINGGAVNSASVSVTGPADKAGTVVGGALNDLDEPAEQEKKKTGDKWMKVDEQDGEAVEGEELEESEETRRVAAATEPSKQMREEHEAQNHAV